MRKRNKFSLSHSKTFTCDMGYLIPISWFEVVPGDSIQMQTSALIRLTPLLAPLMHQIDIRIAHFYVALADIWDGFEDFITGGDDGDDATVPPYIDLSSDVITESYLADYLGVPPMNPYPSGFTISALPFRAYSLIFNEYYRDQDLVSERTVPVTSGNDTTVTYQTLASIAWEKDYFTTARTSQQKGTAITIPFSDDDPPVTGIGRATQSYPYSSGTAYETDGSGTVTYDDYGVAGTSEPFRMEEDPNNSGYPNIRADLSNVGIDIDDFRLSMALQKYMERTNRYGSRYSDYLRQLGIRPLNARRGIPEIIGSGRQTIQFSEVLNHTTTGTQGAMTGHGISAIRSNRARKFIPEHGIVMSLMSARPKAVRSQGLHKSWSKEIKEEYHQKELENIGDQPIKCKELYVDSADPEDTFGYNDIFDEYRSLPNTIAGEFRTVNDHWHMGINYASEPALNSTFITCTPRKDIFASPSTDCMYVQAFNSIQARRPIRKRR